MKAVEVYELALAKGIEEPAVLALGGRHFVGRWVPTAELNSEGACGWILRSKTKAVQVLGEGNSWFEAAMAAGLIETTRVDLKEA